MNRHDWFQVYPDDWAEGQNQPLFFWKKWDKSDNRYTLAMSLDWRGRFMFGHETHALPQGQDWWERGSYEVTMSYIVKAIAARSAAAPASSECQDEDLMLNTPALFEFLCVGEDGQGGARQTATVNLSFARGAFTGFLNDRETGLSLCVTADTILGVLVAIDKRLRSDDPQWLVKGEGHKKPRKRG